MIITELTSAVLVGTFALHGALMVITWGLEFCSYLHSVCTDLVYRLTRDEEEIQRLRRERAELKEVYFSRFTR